jgi:hypothetical protein
MNDFEQQIASLDPGLFRHIESQSTGNDRTSLLALHLAFRQSHPSFKYLEIGSHLGGSLQALVRDPRCQSIVSIDPRPRRQPDERGEHYDYVDNSTARMLTLLRQIPGANADKILALDAGTDTLDPERVPGPPDFCFIDGEHTDVAVVRDARFCLRVIHPDGCIAFHDANIIYRGLRGVIGELQRQGMEFRGYHLPDSVFVVELGACAVHQSPPVQRMLLHNHEGYLWSLMANDEYRQTCRRPLFRALRKLDAKWRRFRGGGR